MRIEIDVHMAIPPDNAFTIDPDHPEVVNALIPTAIPIVKCDASLEDCKALSLDVLEERLAEAVTAHFYDVVRAGWEPPEKLLEAQVRAIEKKRRDEEGAKREESR